MHDSLSERTWGSAPSLEAEISVISRIYANDWLNCRFVNDLGGRKKLRNLWERTRQEGA